MRQEYAIGQATDPGLKRGKGPNQDSIGTAEQISGETRYPMLILADGMGGYFGGEVASRIAVDSVKEVFSASDPEKTGFKAVLRECVDEAHRKIIEKAASDEALSGMGSTIVLAVPTGESVWAANVGDSRAYLISARGEIRQISLDHSLVMEQYRAGLLTKEEAENHPRKNVLTMSLSGQRDKVYPYIREVPWKPGDHVLICSDGLWGPVSEKQICSTVISMEPQEAAEKLVELANRNGGPDNISVLIARNGEKVTAPGGTGEAEIVSAADEGTEPPGHRRLLIAGLILVLLLLGLLLYYLNHRPDPSQAVIRDFIRIFSDVRV